VKEMLVTVVRRLFATPLEVLDFAGKGEGSTDTPGRRAGVLVAMI